MTIWNWLAVGMSVLAILLNLYVLVVDILRERERNQSWKEYR